MFRRLLVVEPWVFLQRFHCRDFHWLFDFGVLKPKIETTVSDLTGREFHIGGDLSVKVLPTPTVLIEGVTLASPEWSKEPQMLEVG